MKKSNSSIIIEFIYTLIGIILLMIAIKNFIIRSYMIAMFGAVIGGAIIFDVIKTIYKRRKKWKQ